MNRRHAANVGRVVRCCACFLAAHPDWKPKRGIHMKTRWNEMSVERHPSSRAKSVHWRAAFLVVHGALFPLLVSACSDGPTAGKTATATATVASTPSGTPTARATATPHDADTPLPTATPTSTPTATARQRPAGPAADVSEE